MLNTTLVKKSLQEFFIFVLRFRFPCPEAFGFSFFFFTQNKGRLDQVLVNASLKMSNRLQFFFSPFFHPGCYEQLIWIYCVHELFCKLLLFLHADCIKLLYFILQFVQYSLTQSSPPKRSLASAANAFSAQFWYENPNVRRHMKWISFLFPC